MPIFRPEIEDGKEIAPGFFRKIAYLKGIMVATIQFSGKPMCHPEEPHSHPHEQISYIAEGSLYVFIDGDKELIKEVDIFLIPSNVPHCIQTLTERVKLVDTFTPRREDFLEE